MRTVGRVRGEESALFVCRIPEGRPERKGILLELNRAGIRRDAVTRRWWLAWQLARVLFVALHRENRRRPNRGPRSFPVLSSSREKCSLRDEGATQNHSPASHPRRDGANCERGVHPTWVRRVRSWNNRPGRDDETMCRVSITPYDARESPGRVKRATAMRRA